ncbi:hypothetical protein H9P43_000890 [Blastocladiella emersonii ATCC 22665]|nr:hypothetical protein H9P43_000890 [Blastocladiella emersonii ATCC 22665]
MSEPDTTPPPEASPERVDGSPSPPPPPRAASASSVTRPRSEVELTPSDPHAVAISSSTTASDAPTPQPTAPPPPGPPEAVVTIISSDGPDGAAVGRGGSGGGIPALHTNGVPVGGGESAAAPPEPPSPTTTNAGDPDAPSEAASTSPLITAGSVALSLPLTSVNAGGGSAITVDGLYEQALAGAGASFASGDGAGPNGGATALDTDIPPTPTSDAGSKPRRPGGSTAAGAGPGGAGGGGGGAGGGGGGDKDDPIMMNNHHRRPAVADMKAGLPNLLEVDDEKESALARLQRRVEERRAHLEKIPVSQRYLGETSWWHFSTSIIFAGLAMLNFGINIRIILSDVPTVLALPPSDRRYELLTPNIRALLEIFNAILLYGLVKDAGRGLIFIILVATSNMNWAMLKWGYAFIAHSPFLLPLFLSTTHRAKMIPALSLINHPKIVFWDIFFGDVPSAILSFLVNYGQWNAIVPILTIAAIFFTTLSRLTRFLWIALLMMNEYGQKRARSLRLLKHLYLWGRGLEYYIVFLGDDADKQKLIQHVKSRVQEFQEMKAKHIQDAWARGFKSIIILNTLQTVVSLLSGIYRFQLDKAPDVSKDLAEFERIVREYEPELIALRNKELWKLSIKDRHIDVINQLWKCELVKASLKKFQTTHADKWQERRFSRLLGVKDILDDPHQITSLLSSSLAVDDCLSNASRILQNDYEPTPEDLSHMPISLTELLFTELCKSVSYHVKDKVLANNICILDVPKGFSRTKLQALIPFCQTLILFLDMNKFDEMVMLAKPKSKHPHGGHHAGGGGHGLASLSPVSIVQHGGPDVVELSAMDLPMGGTQSGANLGTTSSELPNPNGTAAGGGAGAGGATATNGRDGSAAGGGAAPGGGGSGGVLKPRLQVELEFFERICNAKDKNNMVTGILVFWKNYSVFKSRVNTPGTLDNFTKLYPDYNERSHGTLNGPNVIRYFKRRILRAANPGDRYVSIIPDWELNRRFDLFATLNEVIFDHYVVHRVT